MFSSINPLLKLVCFLLVSCLFNQNIYAQTRGLTVSGNIKLIKKNAVDLDECFFHYKDLVTGEHVIIPINRNEAGNYSISMQLDSYQQIYFSKVIQIEGKTFSNTNSYLFSFFAKSGQTMEVIYTEEPRKLSFKGDFATENVQYQSFMAEKDRKVSNIYQKTLDKKMTPAEVNGQVSAWHKELVNFNREYFKAHSLSLFVRQQAYYEAFYGAMDAAINLNQVSGNTVTENMVTQFHNAIKSQSVSNGEDNIPDLKYSLDPNAFLKNSAAVGNRDYKDFVANYFNVFERNLNLPTSHNISNSQMAAYLVKKYPNLKAEEKSLVLIFGDSKKPYSKSQDSLMVLLTDRYANEYLQTLERRTELGKFLAIKDPLLRELGATRYLYKKLNLNEIDYLSSSIEDYQQGVKSPYLKDKLLAAYQQQLATLHDTKLPSLAILNSSKAFTGDDVLGRILAQYKGKVIYLDLWATWCGPCLLSMPASQKLKKSLNSKEVVFVYLCINSPNESGWKNVIAAKSLEGENYFLDRSQSVAVGKTLNISAIPHYAIIDKNGEFVDKKALGPEYSETSKMLNQLIGQ